MTEEAGSIPNRYDGWIADDNDLCVPVINSPVIQEILGEVALRVRIGLGTGPEPNSTLDLEQLQVADYSKFGGVSEIQRDHVRKFHREFPIASEEMVLLALRSLFQFTWPMPPKLICPASHICSKAIGLV